jgi:hypothetical protein
MITLHLFAIGAVSRKIEWPPGMNGRLDQGQGTFETGKIESEKGI